MNIVGIDVSISYNKHEEVYSISTQECVLNDGKLHLTNQYHYQVDGYDTILARISDYENLTKLSIEYWDCPKDKPLILDTTLTQSLNKIKQIELKNVNIRGPLSNLIKRSLKELSLEGTSGNRIDDIMEAIDIKNVKLESLKLRNISELPLEQLEYKYLPVLRELLIYDSPISRDIPENIFDIHTLESLTISDCGLTGQIPESVGSLKYLKYLNLSRNQLTGPIPPTIFGSELARLCLSHNQLTGDIPSTIRKPEDIQFVDLRYNQMSGTVPIDLLIHIGYSYTIELYKSGLLSKDTSERLNVSRIVKKKIGTIKVEYKLI